MLIQIQKWKGLLERSLLMEWLRKEVESLMPPVNAKKQVHSVKVSVEDKMFSVFFCPNLDNLPKCISTTFYAQ